MGLPRNFSWLLAGEVAGCACPSSEAELCGLVEAGVRHLVTLSSVDTPPPACTAAMTDLAWKSLPIPEFRGPSQETLIQFLKICEGARSRQEGVAVHCRMGRGRTGTCLAAYLMRYSSLSARQAIDAVRRARPGSVETRHQEEALESFQKILQDAPELFNDCHKSEQKLITRHMASFSNI
jgi:atypical dual specificity phosphatase